MSVPKGGTTTPLTMNLWMSFFHSPSDSPFKMNRMRADKRLPVDSKPSMNAFGSEMTVTAAVAADISGPLKRASQFPRLRYMGSKYNLAQPLAETFVEIGGRSFLDAFSGSGFVGYLAKSLGFEVTSNDYMDYGRVIASATIANQSARLTDDDISLLTSKAIDGRSFVQDTFDGVFFDRNDREFIDSAWSHINVMNGPKKDLAIAALIQSAAKKQPRGVFTISGDLSRYDDGRKDLQLSLEEQFVNQVARYNAAVFESPGNHRAFQSDVMRLDDETYDVVYLDPPYAPPSDDADYTKRYHFLEGLANYWEDGRAQIMTGTKTKKIPKRHSAFANKRTATAALSETFEKFSSSRALIVSYSSNSVPSKDWIVGALHEVKGRVEVREIPHTYHFGTHKSAIRKSVLEYIIVAGD